MQTEVAASLLRPVAFYEGEFASGTVRLWSGVDTISWNGQSWEGAGNLLGVSPVTETVDVRASGVSVSLSGNVSSLIATALNERRLGKPGKLWLGAMNASGAIIADPYLAFSGRLDQSRIVDGGEDCTIAMGYESRLAALERPRERRWTHEDQQIDFPGDRGFEYEADLPDQVIEW